MISAANWKRIQAFAKVHYARAQSLVRLERRRIGRLPTGREMVRMCQELPVHEHPGFTALLAALRVVSEPSPGHPECIRLARTPWRSLGDRP